MLEECIDGLQLKDGGVYFDGTFGGGGHTREILERKNTKVIATDLDTTALKNADKIKEKFGDKLITVHDNFKNFNKITFAQMADFSRLFNGKCFFVVALEIGNTFV